MRQELKLETLEIGQTLAKKRSDQVVEAMNRLTAQFIKEGNANYTAVKEAILAAKYAIANEKIEQLKDTATSFGTVLNSYGITQEKTITKADGKTVTVPIYYVNVSKQTAESKNGGYSINSLNETELLFFIQECLIDIADALKSYQASSSLS